MRRSTVVALIVFILVAGLYWYTRQENNALSTVLAGTPTPTSAPIGYLVEPYLKTVTSLSIRKPGSPELTLKFAEGGWSGQNGDESLVPLDQQAADSAALTVQDLRILTQIEATGETLSDFDLDEKTATVMEAAFSDGTSIKVLIGRPTVTGSGYYAMDQEHPETILVINKLSLEKLLSLPENPPVIRTDTLESTPTPEQ